MLTENEEKASKLLAIGITIKDVSKIMFLSEDSIIRYLASVYKKMGINNRIQLFNYWWNLDHNYRWIFEGMMPIEVHVISKQLHFFEAKLPLLDKLIDKESETLYFLQKGYNNRMMCKALDINENLLKYRLKRIYDKLQVKNRLQVIITSAMQMVRVDNMFGGD